MMDWTKTLDIGDIKEGDALPSIDIPITLQRLVMEAGANYDLSLMHHDKLAAESVGSPDAFANSYFIMGMYERLLREWAGANMRLRRIGQMRMMKFNSVGETVTFKGSVKSVEDNQVMLELSSELVDGSLTSSAFGIVELL